MKVFLLAAGVGAGLRPLTNGCPKCLLPIAGKPLLRYWIDLFEYYGITDILINIHHHADQVRRYIHKQKETKLNIKLFHEERLLGSGGTILANIDFISGEREFLVCYADNLTNMNLRSFLTYHRSHGDLVTMGLFRTAVPRQCGIVEMNNQGLITSFQEKPVRPQTNLANAGVIAARPAVLSEFPETRGRIDLGHDVLPQVVGRMYGYVIPEYIQDIGTVDNYLDALMHWCGWDDSKALGDPSGRDGAIR
jgi:mannose-1-phosphate guanylyltransferase